MTRTHHPLAVTALAILALSAASPALASDDGVAEAARLALADALASPAFAVTPPPVQARLWVQASRLAQKDKRPADEADALKKALAASPDGSTAAEASARLKELGL
jgi:hypothetical protein